MEKMILELADDLRYLVGNGVIGLSKQEEAYNSLFFTTLQNIGCKYSAGADEFDNDCIVVQLEHSI